MDVFEQSKWASVKEFKKSLKSVGKDGLKKTNEKGQTLLHTAAEGGNHEALKLLLTSKYKLAHLVNTKDGFGGWTPLHYAADGGHLECLDLLISHGAGISFLHLLFFHSILGDNRHLSASIKT
jgi:ankyrin repeat protein